MLTCGVCGFRYIGQTSGAMNLRINQHRSDIGKNTTTKNIGRIEIQHFNKHGFEDVALNIIKIVPNKINRLWYENVYIGIYNAMYPYGLNVIWNNKNLIQAVKQNDKESIYNSRNNSNKRKRVGKGGRKKRENRDIDTVKKEVNILLQDFENSFSVGKIKYGKKISRSIFNYNSIKELMDKKECCCNEYKNYVDEYHGHVITGNLEIVQDQKLREIMSKGTGYRLTISNSNLNVRKQLSEDINKFILNVAIKYNLPTQAFKEYGFMSSRT
ncbi:hypothetical protein TNCV_1755031 [Trichonephila clavipes]|nr:hypothetical protein TNCV_1755031 [Trichonephila clavipes]